ncbi:fungal-specific transcription factor domain-domain-containing protein [Naematelia encephala]|uniref:Fungal-specific transcription factor domain-domain-containing protein n=1 Tax=Naematelia encephala TaxID=71784 RepID=A0A1Y2BB32_9TREE|nr:fungal-specific transcription factor domain-domain-containing protein [Naematelia encephala]
MNVSASLTTNGHANGNNHDSSESQLLHVSPVAGETGSTSALVRPKGSANDKKSSLACLRCKGRKTKCSYDRPECASCVKAKVQCEYPPSADQPVWDYVRQLEARLVAVENEDHVSSKRRRISEHELADSQNASQGGPSRHSAATTLNSHSQALFFAPITQADYAVYPSLSTSSHQDRSLPHHRIQSVEGHQAAASQPYIEPSTIFYCDPQGPPSTFQLLDRLPSFADLDSISIKRPHQACQYPSSKALPWDRNSLPPKEHMDQLIEYFLTYTYSGYPLVHIPTLRKQIEAVRGDAEPNPNDRFCVYMVLAIACTSQAKGLPVSSDLRRQAQYYWQQAQLYVTWVLSRNGLGKLQATHLLLHYVLHNPEAGNIWDLVGSASRICTDLGIHHESESTRRINKILPAEQDLGRKLFWSTYCIDRNLATALGRPPSIPDEWINTRFPSLVVDDCISDEGIRDDGQIDWRKKSIIHHIRLRILQSKIHDRLYTFLASQSPPPSQQWFASMEARLEKWRSSYPPDPTGFLNVDWLDINYHLTRCLLFRPNPGNKSPGKPALTSVLVSCSLIMRLYKSMWRRRSINFVWQAIQYLFMSGVTYLNSLWVASQSGWSIVPSFVDALLDVQACSSSLEAMTLNEHGTTGIRDAFETVSAAVIRRLSDQVYSIPQQIVTGSNPPSVEDASNYLFSDPSMAMSDTVNDSVDQFTLGREMPIPSSASTSAGQFGFNYWLDPSRPPSPRINFEEPNELLDSFFLHPLTGMGNSIGVGGVGAWEELINFNP